MNNRIALFTFGDFGCRSNLKTNESAFLFNTLVANGINVDFFSRLGKERNIVPVLSYWDLLLCKIASILLPRSYRELSQQMYRYRAKKIIKKNKYDVGIFYPYHLTPEHVKIKAIGVCVTMEPRGVSKYLSKVGGSVYNRLYSGDLLYEKCHALVCVSQRVADSYRKFFERDIWVDSLVMPTEKQKFDALPRVKKFLCITTKISKAKGIDVLLSAWKALRREGVLKDEELIITGESYADCPISKDDSKENIIYTGLVDDIFQYLNQVNYMILPSLFEGHCRSTEEALSVGVPVIVSEAALASAIDGVNAVLIKQPTEKDIKDAISYSLVYENYLHLKQGADRGSDSKKFFGEHTAEKLRELL